MSELLEPEEVIMTELLEPDEVMSVEVVLPERPGIGLDLDPDDPVFDAADPSPSPISGGNAS